MSNVLSVPGSNSLTLNDIPEAYRPQENHFNQYLIGGELKTWEGEMARSFVIMEMPKHSKLNGS